MAYAKWLAKTGITLSNNDLTATPSQLIIFYADGAIPSGESKKIYWEIELTGSGTTIGIAIGVGDSPSSNPVNDGWSYYGTTGDKRHSNYSDDYGDSFDGGDIIGIAVDVDNGNITFYKNNVTQGYAYTNMTVAQKICALSVRTSDAYTNISFILHSDPADQTYTAPSGYTAGYEASETEINEINAGIGINASARFVEDASDLLLLIHSDDTDASTTFEDGSLFDRTIDVQGNAQHSTTEQKFDASAMEFYRSSSPGLLSIANGAEKWDRVGDNDFTIDFWLYHDGGPSTVARYLSVWGALGGNRSWSIFWVSSAGMRIQWQDNLGTYYFYTFGNPTYQAWTHIAVVRKGTRLLMFRGGVLILEEVFAAGTTFGPSTMPLQIGGYDEDDSGDAGENAAGGFLDEIRICSVAKWDDDFDPPTLPYGNPATATPDIYVGIGIGNEVVASTDAEQYAAWSDRNIDGNWSFTYSGPEQMRITKIEADDNFQRAEVDKVNITDKYYFEWVTYPSWSTSNFFVGLTKINTVYDNFLGADNKGYSVVAFDGDKFHNSPGKFGVPYGESFTGGDIVMCAHDPISGKIWWGKNGTWFDSGDPAAGTGAAYTDATGQLIASISGKVYGDGVTLRSSPHQLTYAAPSGFTPGIRGQDADVPVPLSMAGIIGIGKQVRFLEDAPPVGGNDEFTYFLVHSNANDGSTIFENDAFNKQQSVQGTLEGSPYHSQGQRKFDRSSIYFDGSYAVVVFEDTVTGVGANEFTIDLWLYIHYVQHDGDGLINSADTYWGGWSIFFEGEVGVDGGQRLVFQGNTNDLFNYCESAADCIPLDQWVHVALVKRIEDETNYYQFFINGDPSGTEETNSNIPFGQHDVCLGNKEIGVWSSNLLHGWMDEIRISSTPRYTEAFTPKDGPYTSLQEETEPVIDVAIGIGSLIEVFSDVELPPAESFGNDLNTLLLIHSDSVQGDSEFIDASNYAEPLLTVGNTIHDDDDPKMGDTAILFDGYQDQINTAKLDIYEPGFNPFTIDFWINPNTQLYHAGIMTSGDVATGGWVIEFDNNSRLRFIANGVVVCTTTDFIPYGVWTHIALVRTNTSSTGYQFWVGGYASGEPGDASLALPTTDNGIMIGRGNAAFWPSLYYDGLLDEIRVSDVARFTEPFTVKETPYSSPVTQYEPEIFAGIGIHGKVWAGEEPRSPLKMINLGIGIGSTVNLGSCAIQSVNVGIGIGAKMHVHPYLYSQVNVGIGIGSSMEFQPMRIVREVNIGIRIGTKITLSNPVFLEARAVIGIGTVAEITSQKAVRLNAGIGISSSVTLTGDGDADAVECELPAFSDDRWC